jgi:streptogramin lyase
VASAGRGASYFQPDYNLFQTLIPTAEQSRSGDELWARMAAETPDGHLWLATGMGLMRFDRSSGEYKFYQNVAGQAQTLYSNSIRSLCVDRKGNLWIGTADGVNVLRAGAQKIEFLPEKEGFVQGFTLGITEDRRGTLWFATTGDGIYYLPFGEKKARSIREHPWLKPFTGFYGHTIFEDREGRLWIGFNGRGLVCYDPQQQSARHWERTPENDSTLLGNYIYSFAEDQSGVIWVCTPNGISSIDPANNFRFRNFDRARGLPTNRTMSVMADRYDRLWIGSSKGLILLDSTRRLARLFDIHDGLPVNEFSDMPAYRMRDGRFLFPSRRGFVLFNPDNYQSEKTDMPLLLSHVKVFNRSFATNSNYEILQTLNLPPGQNFFTLEMTALNYRNPQQTWYAYKMEPFDREWTYTQERSANYTDVPSGHFTFRY